MNIKEQRAEEYTPPAAFNFGSAGYSLITSPPFEVE